MDYVADLHLHSKYSRAVSPKMTLPVMADFAREKGIDILSASDFTHPLWFKEIQGQLEEAGEGVYRLRSEISNFKSQISNKQKEILFLLSTEISSIYKEGEKLRRIHNLVFVPSLEIAEKVSKELSKRGCNLSADGRPIIGLSSRNLLEMVLELDERCLLIPCHVWTPHFGLYGSKSGYDSIEEAFGDYSKYIYGIETGISSDPEMNWRIQELKNRSILSFSDAHSPANMGREATVFAYKNGISNSKFPISNTIANISYEDIRKAIMRELQGNLKIAYTIEFYPEEGKYHFSGHRNCNISLSPQAILDKGTSCPNCHRELVEGVAVRIEQLAGSVFAKDYIEKKSESGISWHTDKSKNHPPFVKLVRFEQVIASAFGTSSNTIKVKSTYAKLIRELGSELEILLKIPLSEVEKLSDTRVCQALDRVRGGRVVVEPGYDGTYGKVKIFDENSADLPAGKAGQNSEDVNNSSQLKFDI